MIFNDGDLDDANGFSQIILSFVEPGFLISPINVPSKEEALCHRSPKETLNGNLLPECFCVGFIQRKMKGGKSVSSTMIITMDQLFLCRPFRSLYSTSWHTRETIFNISML